MEREREIETLAIAVHGALASLHLLSLLYNARRRNVGDCIAHGLGVLYDANAVRLHGRALSRLS